MSLRKRYKALKSFNSNLLYEKQNPSLLIGITACSMSLFAQDRKVSGIVKGKSDQELIIGANVLIKGTKRGTVTNVNGKFAIYVGQSDKELE